jgi:quercetin dioxygenase-like cupin family protein
LLGRSSEEDPVSIQTVCINAAELPLERWSDAARGAVSWRTLLSADRTPSRALVCGLASFEPGDRLELHRHAQDEVYFGISGRALVTISGEDHVLEAGTVLFVPGNAPHAVTGLEAAEFFYVFAGDSFEEVIYEFLEERADGP